MTEKKELTATDLQVGKTYRAKRFKEFLGYTNDRTILWISPRRDKIQYDSSTVKDGRCYPTVDVEKFLKWASHEVTEKRETQ